MMQHRPRTGARDGRRLQAFVQVKAKGATPLCCRCHAGIGFAAAVMSFLCKLVRVRVCVQVRKFGMIILHDSYSVLDNSCTCITKKKA